MSLALKSASIPSGMASMLKMFGVDPAQVIESAKKTGDAVHQIAATLERICRRLERIETKLGIEEENGEQLTVASGAGAGKIGR